MALREKLEVIVDANVQGFVRGMDKAGAAADKNLGKTDEKIALMSGRLTTWGAALAGAGAVGAIGLGKLATMAADAERSQLKLSNSVQNSANAFKDNGAALRAQASELQRYTAAEDDAVVGAQAMLVQFGLTEQQVSTLTPLMVDLSRKMGVDLDAAAKAVGKSATGTTTALKRMGIDVEALGEGSSSAEKTISALSKSVGGFATAEGKTFSGQLAIIKNQLGEIGEGVGGGVIDVVKPFAEFGATLNDINPDILNTAGRIAAIGTAGATAAGGLSFVAGQALKLKDTMPGVAAAFATLGAGPTAAIAAVGVGLGVIVSKALESKTSVSQLSQELAQFAATGNIDDVRESVNNLADDLSGSLDFGESWLITLTGGAQPAVDAIDDVRGSYEQLQELARQNPAAGELLIDVLSQRADILNNSNFKAVGGLKGLNDAIQEGKQLASGAAALAQENADALGNEAEAADEAASAWKDYAAAVKAATDPLFAVTDSSEKVADAQKGVAEAFAALGDGGTVEEVEALADAQRNAAKAGLDHLAAVTSLRAGIESGDVSLEQAIGVLDDLTAQFPELGGAVQTVKADFQAAAAEANNWPTSLNTEVKADSSKFDSIIARVIGTKIPPKQAAVEGEPSKFDAVIRRIAGTRPPAVRVPVDADTSSFQSKLNGLLAGFRSSVATISVNPFRPAADGFVSYAAGGTRLPQNAMIAPGRGAGLVQWAEQETGGEAFIPLAPSKRGRSKKLWVETGKRLGVLPMADGGIRSFGFGGFTADDYTGQLVEQMNNFWQAQFDSASLGRQAELAAQRRDVLQPWSDEWVKWNNIAVDSLQKLAAEQADIAERAAADQREAMERNAAAAKDIADNQFDWMYDHASDLEKLQIAISKRDSFGQFTDDWVQWAKEVEQLQMAGVGTARSTASGGRSQGSAPFYLTVNVNAEGLVTDPSEVGRQVVGAIRSYEQQNGTAWRS